MKINSYEIGMDSERTFSSESTRRLSIRMLGTGEPERNGDFFSTYTSLGDEGTFWNEVGAGVNENDGTKVKGEDSRDTWNRFANVGELAAERIDKADSVTVLRDIQSIRQQFVLYLWRLLFGDKEAKDMAKKYGLEDANSYKGEGTGNAENYGTGYSEGYGTGYSKNYGIGEAMTPFTVIKISGVEETYYSEKESLSFRSFGSVTTEDGRSMDINISLSMSRSFEQYYRREGIEIPKMCDPLVLHFDGDASALSDTKFEFDLDCDGEAETISRLCEGSGYLALDRNGDGIINDGSELFGTKSGDGFGDLSIYDEDGNGWIDENDTVFDKLRIWVMDEEGNENLLNLKEKGVGAIFLGNTSNNFTLRSFEEGKINGAIRSMGIFLYENGGVGTMSQLDIAN